MVDSTRQNTLRTKRTNGDMEYPNLSDIVSTETGQYMTAATYACTTHTSSETQVYCFDLAQESNAHGEKDEIVNHVPIFTVPYKEVEKQSYVNPIQHDIGIIVQPCLAERKLRLVLPESRQDSPIGYDVYTLLDAKSDTPKQGDVLLTFDGDFAPNIGETIYKDNDFATGHIITYSNGNTAIISTKQSKYSFGMSTIRVATGGASLFKGVKNVVVSHMPSDHSKEQAQAAVAAHGSTKALSLFILGVVSSAAEFQVYSLFSSIVQIPVISVNVALKGMTKLLCQPTFYLDDRWLPGCPIYIHTGPPNEARECIVTYRGVPQTLNQCPLGLFCHRTGHSNAYFESCMMFLFNGGLLILQPLPLA